LGSIPDWEKHVIEAYPNMVGYADNSKMMVPLPTIEGIAYLLYRLAGGEHMWLPRAFSALAWVIGGVFLYLLAKRLMTREAALLATGFYLFLPVAITGSRSFQVEPLMVAAMICSVYAIFLHQEKPTLRRALIAAAVAAVAILIRPLCAFMIFGAFVALSLKRQGLRRTMVDPHSWLFGVLAVLPMAALILYDKFFPVSSAMAYFQETTLQPQLLLRWDYYAGWANYLFGVIGSWDLSGLQLLTGPLTLGAAVIGTIMLRKRHARALVIGLWCGYVAFCVVFTYLVSNHHYHHLQIVPVIALGLGPIAEAALRWVANSVFDMFRSRWLSRIVVGGILFVVVMSLVWPVAASMVTTAELGRECEAEAQTIGELIDHSTDVIVLPWWRGFDDAYHGWFFGRWWVVQGADVTHVEALLHNMCQDWQPTHFVITDLAELDRQPALKEFLFAKYPIVAQTDTYLIFDLRESLASPDDPL